MLTPFIISNRSVFPTTYHKHTDTLEGQYTLIRSSTGNDDIVDRHSDMIGEDVEADFKLFWVNCIPISSTMSKIQIVMHINLGGSLPGPMRAMISKKQAGLIETLQSYFAANATEMEESYNRSREKIAQNIQAQKEEREAAVKKAEEKKQREEARAKKKQLEAEAK